MPPRITVLHLSDLQCGNRHAWWAPRHGESSPPIYDGRFHDQIVGELLKLRRTPHGEPTPVDLIAVTGDIAERGDIDEYGAALQFLLLLQKSLKDAFDLRPEICVIPGNHDINRRLCERARAKGATATVEFEAKFSAYNEFARQIDESLQVSFDQPFVFMKSVHQHDKKKIQFEFVGLNSCIRESDLEHDHYGYVGERQLMLLHDYLRKQPSSPYALRVAAFHHNALLQGAVSAELIEELYKKSQGEGARPVAMDLRNYLHDSRPVLAALAADGFHVALHGHQHYDDMFNLSLPRPLR